MNNEYSTDSIPAIIGAGILLIIALGAAFQTGGAFVAFLAGACMIYMIISHVMNYRKYIVEEDSLKIVSWSGDTTAEIDYSNVEQYYMHRAYGQTSGNFPTDAEADTLVFILKSGEMERFNVSSVSNSDHLNTNLRAKIYPPAN